MVDVTNPIDESKNLILEKPDEVYRFISLYYLHQDKLSWSRTQTMVLIESGILAAAYKICSFLSIVPLLLGAIIVFLFWGLIQRDWQIRDNQLEKLDDIHKYYGVHPFRIEAKHYWWKGRFVAFFLTYSAIVFNIIVSIFLISYYLIQFFERVNICNLCDL